MENSVQVPKFDGKNFASWKFRIVSILEGKELDDLLEGDPPEDEVKFKEWKKKDAQAKGIITCAMTDSLVALILNCKTSKDIWIALHERYEGDKKKRIIEARNDVSRLTMKKEENWEEYLYRSEKLLEQARNLGAEIEDQEFTTSVIRGLPQKYNLVALQLNSQMKEGNSKAFNTIHKESFSNSKHFHKNRNGNKPICFICAKPGHKAIECWHNPKNKRGSENKQTSKNKPEHQNKAKFVNLQPEEHVSNIKEYETTQQPEEWVVDSGASCHMTSNRDLLKEEREVHKTIKLADDSEIIYNAEGAIEIEGQNKLIRLNDLYVEKLSGNLMSVNKLVDDNKKVLFDKDGGHIMEEDGEEILMAQRINDFYIIKTSAPEEIPSQALKATLHTWNDWHKRLGHLNEEYMKQMLKNNSAHNFNTQSQNMDTCQVCIQAKHPRTPFKPVLYPQSTRPLDLIHIDLIGPIQEESIGGAKYVLTLVDDFSRKIFVEFLSSKLETFDIIRSFIEEIEKEKEIKVKQLRSDNGKEFTNNQMTQYLKGKGIKHQLTNVYTPQQNGISERYNRTLIEGTRALLIDSQLPLRYWAETMSTFAYLKNRTPCKKLGWITPEERFSNRKPTVAHLKIFGCIAYYYVHKHKRGKFQPTAKAGIFVGYSSTRKAWRLIDPENENVIETRDVKFLENKLGKEILNKNDSDDTQKYFLYNFPEDTIPETSEEVENHDDHSHSDLENQDEHSELPYNLRPNLKDKLYYELSSDDEPIEDNEGKDPTYDPTVGALKLSHGNLLPSSYEEAINHPDSPLWQQAMDKEIHPLQNHHVWDLAELPEGAKAIKSKWIFSKKMDPQTNQKIYKARLVALGCSQEYGTDYTETFSPVMKTDSFRTLLAYATMAGYEFHHFDVETAFLYGKLSETIYMTQPPGYKDDKKKTSVCILNQALYGLKQSGRVWYETFTEYLFEIGLTQLKSDKCVFTFRNGNSHLLLGLHVDDMIIINSDPEILHDIIQKIRLHFKIKESLTTCNILGIEIIKEDVRLILKQENYINKILQKYNMQDCKHISTPLDPNTNLDNFNSSKEVNKTQYQELIGSLLYLSTKSRPDIAFAVTLLSRYNQNPREMHMGAAKRILRYLKGTKQYGLIYTKGDVELKAYTDASWNCGRSNKARSTAGLTFYLDKNLISWSKGIWCYYLRDGSGQNAQFKRSPLKNEILLNYMRQDNRISTSMCLIHDCRTRWNSLLNMLKRLLSMKSAIQKALIDVKANVRLTDEDFDIMTQIISALKPFRAAVATICRRDATLLTAEATVKFLLKELQAQYHSLRKDLQTFFQKIILEERCNKTSLVLQYLHNPQTQLEKKKMVKDFSVKLLLRLKPLQEQMAEVRIQADNSQLPRSLQERHEPSQSNDHLTIERQLQEAIEAASSTSIAIPTPDSASYSTMINHELKIAAQSGKRGPHLESVYQFLLTIPPTSVESERVFSSSGYLCNKIRSSLHDDTFDKLPFLRSNLSRY
ncbi:hypothetical protein LAZ67_8003037 [Cordylochernes scorpioides]|uniref:Retrovirus-related Pol polyprotein from transposon TNT 1-94 n=1 Tax=Cordylochernes scorpioides TaxID=51811 RepID=A0ABY6KRW5_9ARAC|nr:hypothetical protein LAZ67_8003037 [Cordylochernes scorpioides]